MSTLTLFRDPFFNTTRRGTFFDSLLDDFFDVPKLAVRNAISDRTLPTTRTSEHDDHFEISLVAPGLIKEDFNISLEGRNLTVSFEGGDEEGERMIDYSSFTKSWTLPEGTLEEDIEAEYVSGILTLNISKQGPPETSVKTISIK